MSEYELKIKADHLRVIGAALQDLPYKVAAPVIAAIDAQIISQERAVQPAEAVPE